MSLRILYDFIRRMDYDLMNNVNLKVRNRRKIVSLLLLFMMLAGMFSGGTFFAEAATEDIPEYIETTTIDGVEYLLFDSGQDMEWLRYHVLAGGDIGEGGSHIAEGQYCTHNIMLTADIDMTEYNGLDSEGGTLSGEGYNNTWYSGIGYAQNGLGYSGIFDGNGHTISNIDIYNNANVGPKGLLFNLTRDATVRNLVVSGKAESNRYMGGLIGRATGSLTVENVVVNGDVFLNQGNQNAVGGLIGQLGAGQTYSAGTVTITNCATVGSYRSDTSTNQVGGLIGHIYGGFTGVNISNCYSAAELTADRPGGLIGANGSGKLTMDNCYWLDSMAETSIYESLTIGDASPVTPDSGFIDASSVSESVMKSSSFINQLGGGFKGDDQSVAGGYPIPATIGSYNASFLWSGSPTLEYKVGDTFDLAGLRILALSDDGNVDVTAQAEISKTDALTLEDDGSTITVTVSYDGKTESRDYTVSVVDLREIYIDRENSEIRTEYYEGERFDTSEIRVFGVFGDEEEVQEITAYSYSPSGALEPGTYPVVITYLGMTEEIEITVTERYVTYIEVTEPDNLIYAANEDVDGNNLTVMAYYTEGNPVLLSPASAGGNGYTCSVDRASGTVRVSYTEKGNTYGDSFQVTFLSSNTPLIQDGVCQISSADDLVWFANQVNALGRMRDAVLLNDIDLGDSELFSPIGNTANPYAGTFDGNDHKVTLHLTAEGNEGCGLFGNTSNAELRSINVAGSIEGAQVQNTAGIVGNAVDTVIDGCINEADIITGTGGGGAVGGIVGRMSITTSEIPTAISNCVNKGRVVGSTGIGGIAGHMNGTAASSTVVTAMQDCSNYGAIEGANYIGGIAGATCGSIRNCHNSGTIDATGSGVGGIVGSKGSVYALNAESEIDTVSNTGNVTGNSNVGGIAGTITTGASTSANNGHVTVENAYNTGNIEALTGTCGGIIGANTSVGGASSRKYPENIVNDIKNVYNTGNVTAPSAVGGIVGQDAVTTYRNISGTHTLQSAYNVGNVSLTEGAEGTIGTVVGEYSIVSRAEYPFSIGNVYYLSDESVPNAYNTSNGASVTATDVTSKTSEELKSREIIDLLGDAFSFVHSNDINDGYPILSWQIENMPEDLHVWDGGVVTKEATTSEEGEMTYTCTVEGCGATKTEAIPKLEPSGGGGGGGGGSTTDSTQRDVTVSDTANGTVSVSPEKAKSGETVTVKVTPDEGYVLESLKVTDADGEEITVTGSGDTYTFRMPASAVSVEAVFAEDSTEEPPVSEPLPFTDVSETAWYYDDVRYAYENGLMTGTAETAFSPSEETDRVMIVTILWRLEGSPESVSAGFDDVAAGAYYADAVAWASENSIVEGYEDGNFRPSNVITREELATIIYRYAAFKGYDMTASADLSSFTDTDQISSYALGALRWANAEGLVNGVGGNLIDPKGSAQRSQVAAIFSRFCQNIAEL